MRNKTIVHIPMYLLIILLLIYSFLIRINYDYFYNLTGFLQGDLLYFYSYYHEHIKNSFFFPIEYPVGYILILKITFFINNTILGFSNYPGFIYSNLLLILPLIILIILFVEKISIMIKKNPNISLFYLLFSPTFIVTSTQNYDIVVVFFIILSIFLLLKNHPILSFFVLAIGVCIKIFPIFLIPIIILYLLSKKESALKIGLSISIFFITIFLINFPYIKYDLGFWRYPYEFQLNSPFQSVPNTLVYHLKYVGLSQYRSILFILVLLFSWLITLKFYFSRKLTDKALIYLSYLVILSIILMHSVYSVQYSLWFLPFLAILQIPKLRYWWPFDFINASVIVFYGIFSSTEYYFLGQMIFIITPIYLICLYFYLLYKIKRLYEL